MAELQVLDASFERLIDSRAPIENIATEHHHVRVFDLGADGSLRYGRVCAQLIHNEVLGRADGMKLDVKAICTSPATRRKGSGEGSGAKVPCMQYLPLSAIREGEG